MVEVARNVGLGTQPASRVAVADLDLDGRPDVILERTRVFLNRAGASAEAGSPSFRLEPIEAGLDDPGTDGVSIFVDVTGDRFPDAITVRSRGETSWQRGRGDGRFEARDPGGTITAAPPGTVGSIAAGDVDRDGRTDLLIGRWYGDYGKTLDAFAADLLLNRADAEGLPRFERAALPEDDETFDEERDAAGRPLYGTKIVTLLEPARAPPPQLLELAYGRRWNRLYAQSHEAPDAVAPRPPRNLGAAPPADAAPVAWTDLAPALRLDGDADRSGAYPEWLKERAKTDPRFARETEKPFRANGNTFDAAVGDIDGDGRFDLALAEITHAWAGPSSDRSRVLLQRSDGFTAAPAYGFDRIPPADSDQSRKWNQGDLFVELADLDLDGRLDLILASGDYPDPPPFDERLRIYLQHEKPDEHGRLLRDATAAIGLDLPGCGQIALADFDLDGRVDVLAGQSFTRFTPDMIAAAGGAPRVRLFLNRRATEAPATPASLDPAALSLELVGDPARGVAALPHGAIVEIVTTAADGTESRQMRQLMGPGGHAGKQSEARLHAGLGAAREARVRVTWPAATPITSEWRTLPAGRHTWRLDPAKEGQLRK